MSSKDDERGYLGERLNDHPSPYQPDGPLGWDRMAPKLFPRRKRRGVFLWWTVGGLVVVVGLLYILFPDQFQPGTPAPVAARTTIPPPDPAEVPITDITGSGTQASTKIQGGSVENTPALAPERMADRPPEPSQTYAPGFRQRDLRPGMPDSSEVTRDLPPPVAGPVVGEKADPVQVLPLQPLVAAPPGFPAPLLADAEARPAGGSFGLTVGTTLPVGGVTGAPELSAEATIPWTLSPVTGPVVELEYAHDLGGGWHLRPGVRYQRLSQTVAYRAEEALMLYRPGTPDTIYRNPYTGTVRTVTTDSIGGTLLRDFRQTNHEHRVAANLLVEKRLPLGTKGSVSVLVGASYLVHTRRRGILPQRLGRSLKLPDLPDRRPVGRFGLLAGLSASRYLSQRWQWTARISYQADLDGELQALSLSTGLLYVW